MIFLRENEYFVIFGFVLLNQLVSVFCPGFQKGRVPSEKGRAGRHEKGAGRRALQKKPRQNTECWDMFKALLFSV